MPPTALARRCGATLAGQLQLELQLNVRTARQRNRYLPRSARVRRQGLEPRTRGLRVRRKTNRTVPDEVRIVRLRTHGGAACQEGVLD